MERTVLKKNANFTADERNQVIQMIDNGASLKDVTEWCHLNFGNSITIYYRALERVLRKYYSENELNMRLEEACSISED